MFKACTAVKDCDIFPFYWKHTTMWQDFPSINTIDSDSQTLRVLSPSFCEEEPRQ